jgi:hypothetical protein
VVQLNTESFEPTSTQAGSDLTGDFIESSSVQASEISADFLDSKSDSCVIAPPSNSSGKAKLALSGLTFVHCPLKVGPAEDETRLEDLSASLIEDAAKTARRPVLKIMESHIGIPGETTRATTFTRSFAGSRAQQMIDQNFVAAVQSAKLRLQLIREQMSSARQARTMRQSGTSPFEYTQNYLPSK